VRIRSCFSGVETRESVEVRAGGSGAGSVVTVASVPSEGAATAAASPAAEMAGTVSESLPSVAGAGDVVAENVVCATKPCISGKTKP
jgi:phage-related tail protein